MTEPGCTATLVGKLNTLSTQAAAQKGMTSARR